jgi:integrase
MKTTYPSDPRWPRLRWDRDRHGTLRCYYRNADRPGSKQTRLRAPFGSEAFDAEYMAAEAQVLAGAQPEKRTPKVQPRANKPDAVRIKDGDFTSLNYLLSRYYQSTEFTTRLGATTQKERRRALDKMCTRVVDGWPLGERRYGKLEKGHVMDLRDDLAATPTMANALVKALRGAFKYALDRKMAGLAANPCDGVKRLAVTTGYGPDGFYTWTVDDVEQFEERHPEGTRANDALRILLYTGGRGSDAIRLNDDMCFDGIDDGGKRCRFLSFEPKKNHERKKRENKDPVRVTIPILPDLQRVLDRRPAGQKHWFLTHYGKPYGFRESFTAIMRTWCDAAGLPQCSAHGLRKAGASFAAANGATTAQLMAIYGWETEQQPGLYIKKFARQRAATLSMHLVAKPPRALRRKSGTGRAA